MISFIVPTKDEEDYIRDCLNSIRSQSTDKEIIVVDGGSQDKTVRIARELADEVILNIDSIGKARHEGSKKATGKYLAFIDADTVLNPIYSEKMIQFIEENNLVAASSQARPLSHEGLRSQLVHFLGNMFFDKLDPAMLPGFNTFVKADLYFRSKGFEAVPSEDLQFSREIAKYGQIDILDQKLVHNSGRRIENMGLIGSFIHYLKKDIELFLHNL